MIRLSVNINKIATLRNARGGSEPNVVEAGKRVQEYGADGVTVHPRPDARHITYQDVRDLRPVVHTEFNVEGYPSRDFLDLVIETKPEQVTLVPDGPDVLTSNAGWDTLGQRDLLSEVVKEIQSHGMRVSLFIGTERNLIEGAAALGADRIELYTEPFADQFSIDPEAAVAPFAQAAAWAHEAGLGINAGHDLNRANLPIFSERVAHLAEVSIGHALVADALYLGMENTVQLYLRALGRN